MLAAVLGFASAFALQQRNVENARSDERRRNERTDRAVRLQVLAYLKAEANEIRFAYTGGIMELSVMSTFTIDCESG
ncbi:MAG TPA: hypothetical protein VGU66_06985 [Candidatus Elarobacter sp.]|nr:hypothetical protein [Candidatus Elarobacter sp.]